MIAIIDYDGGNYKSVINILNRSRIKFILTNNEKEISKCKNIILPGVSNFDYCMKKLKSLNLDKILYDAVIVNKKKILGICSGMQVLGNYSEEGNVEGLNFVNGTVKKIESDKYFKVPHMGWNKVNTKNNDLFKDIKDMTRFYFCHSYYFSSNDKNLKINITNYKFDICAAFNYLNIYGVQFHPEKSYIEGSKLINNFYEIS